MGQEPLAGSSMNPSCSGGKGATAARSSGYNQKALAQIRNSLLPFATTQVDASSSASSTLSTTSGVSSASGFSSSASNGYDKELRQLAQMGYSEDISARALKLTGGRFEAALEKLKNEHPPNGLTKLPPPNAGVLSTKLIRKPSLERELNMMRGSPAMDSGAGSSRSDSPRQVMELMMSHQLGRQYSPSNFSEPPPPPPPRSSTTPPPPPPPHSYPTNVQQLLKRMSPCPQPSTRGTSPVSRQPMVVQNSPQVQQQLSQQIQALALFPSSGEPPPPYPIGVAPPPYPSCRQSPTQQDYRKSPSSGIYSGPASAGSPSPVTVSGGTATPTSVARPTPLTAWTARQAKTQPPIIMHSVKSTQVQKPVLQTAIAPTAPQPPPPPSYASSIQQKQQQQQQKPPTPTPSPPAAVVNVPTTEPPSYASTMQALAAQRAAAAGAALPPPSYGPPPPPPPDPEVPPVDTRPPPPPHHPLQRKYSPAPEVRGESPASVGTPTTPPLPPTASSSIKNANTNTGTGVTQNGAGKIDHQSPIPERKKISKEKEDERRDCKVRNYSPQAFKFFMEQHVENVIKSHRQRVSRRLQLEKEMSKIGLSEEAQTQMRRMLSQKESNYIRLKRAKMDKSMFVKLKPIGVGAFGEVTLVKKIDTNHLYAMKTLRKADVLKRNQVAHVKAERDILAEADNEWVVKLYYSFQDKDNLYFVMDYIPGGDLMSLLIKLGIFEEPLARFYIAELTCAVESVHKMGFIHRDIKPDNILIDKDGHIKLTDFGLCTGFRWTHNSKYYQRNGEHGRQDSMEPSEEWSEGGGGGVGLAECKCHQLKPLERRRRLEHQRCLAHSLVGTPNYIAPEVLLRTGYTQLCDWWSVGVILYEMVFGSPPFYAPTPAETQFKVIHWDKTLQIPKDTKVSSDGIDLILKLCTSADKRLGKNASEVKAHPFFAGIDFERGVRRQSPPHIPRIKHSTDTSNFDPVDPDKLRNSSSGDSAKSDEFSDSGKPFHGFFEFTFRRFFDDGGGSNDNENQGGAVYV